MVGASRRQDAGGACCGRELKFALKGSNGNGGNGALGGGAAAGTKLDKPRRSARRGLCEQFINIEIAGRRNI